MPVGLVTPVATFLWNLTQNVGMASPNVAEDVQFVQLAYFIMGTDRSLTFVTEAQRAVYSTVNPRAPYTAIESDPLTRSIRTHQASRGGTQDGHVSAFRGSGSYTAGGQSFTMMLSTLNVAIALNLGDNWPRLEKHEMCGTELAARSRSTFNIGV